MIRSVVDPRPRGVAYRGAAPLLFHRVIDPPAPLTTAEWQRVRATIERKLLTAI